MPDSVTAFATTAINEAGTPVALVNTVGWDMIQPFIDNTSEYWDEIVDLNFMGPVRVTRAFLDSMIAAGTGAIVNVASDAGRVGSTGETIYAGAKGGVIAFTKSLAREMARHGIRVNPRMPGPDRHAIVSRPAGEDAGRPRALSSQHDGWRSCSRSPTPSPFSSNRSTFITGQVLSVAAASTMVG